MPVTIRNKFQLKKKLKKVQKEFPNAIKNKTKELIVESIQKGLSPVEKGGSRPKNSGGKTRYIKYSDSYTKAIKDKRHPGKRLRPVNLTLSGDMLRTIKARRKQDGVLSVFFSSAIAKYHNKLGAGKSKTIRRLLPVTGENFSRNIQRKILEITDALITKVFK